MCWLFPLPPLGWEREEIAVAGGKSYCTMCTYPHTAVGSSSRQFGFPEPCYRQSSSQGSFLLLRSCWTSSLPPLLCLWPDSQMLPEDTDAEPSTSAVYSPLHSAFSGNPMLEEHILFSPSRNTVFSNDFYEVGWANLTADNKAGSGPSNEAAWVGLLTALRTCSPGFGFQRLGCCISPGPAFYNVWTRVKENLLSSEIPLPLADIPLCDRSVSHCWNICSC